MPVCWFCHEAAQILTVCRSIILKFWHKNMIPSKLTFLLLLLLVTYLLEVPPPPSAPPCGVDVSTITSGCTTISVDEYDDGSSVIVVRDRSDGILRGYFIFLLDLVARTGRFRIFFFNRGEFSGEGVGILSALSLGRTWNSQTRLFRSP